MRRSLAVISLLVISVFLSAQNPYKIDSLFNAYEKTGNSGCAVSFFNELKSLTDTLFTVEGKSKDEIDSHLYYVYAKYIERRGLYSKSVHYALIGVEKAEKIKHINEEYAAEFYSLLCVCYHYLGSLDNAIANAEKCYEIDKRSGNKLNMVSTLANIASLYDTSHKYVIAEKYLKQALDLVEELDNGKNVASLLGTASLIYLHKDDYDKAYEYASKAYELDSLAGRKDRAAIRQTQMADVLMKKGNKETALQMYRIASEEFNKDGNINYLSHCKEMLGDLNGALELARKTGNILYQRTILDALASKENNAEKALEYMNESCMLYDSITSIENTKMLEKFEVEYETIQKGNELERQQTEINFQKTLWRYSHYIGVVLVIIVVVTGYGWIRNAKDKKKLDAINAVKDRMIGIVSHDISGSVSETNMIAHMIDDKWKNDISKTLLAQSDAQKILLENLLIWVKLQKTGALQCKTLKLSLNDVAMELIKMFEPVAMAKNIDLKMKASKECVVETDRYILTCILRNLISNAIKFTPSGGTVCIEIGEGSVAVSDTGIGITQKHVSSLVNGTGWIHTLGTNGESGTGLGISIVRKMLRILEGKLEISSVIGCGSTFKILLKH